MKRLLILMLVLLMPVSLQAQEGVVDKPVAQDAETAEPPKVPKFLQFLFPSLRDEGLGPAETLQAPFADAAQEGGEVDSKNRSLVPLHLPHRTTEDVSSWIMTTISESMSFDESDYRADFEQIKPLFDQGGWAQYQAFLQDKKILNVLQSGQYNVRSYVKEVPALLNDGAVSQRYRWLYDVPIMVSYLKRGARDYKDVEPVNQDIVLRVQIGRSEQAGNDMGLLVERVDGRLKTDSQGQ